MATPAAATAEKPKDIWADGDMELDDEILRSSTDDIAARTRLLENDIKVSLAVLPFASSKKTHSFALGKMTDYEERDPPYLP